MTDPAPGRRRLSLDQVFALAAEWHGNGRLAEAARLYRMLVVQVPDAAAVWSNLCSARTAQGRGIEAVAAGRRAVRGMPASARPWLCLGRALLAQRDARRAVEALEKACALDPADPTAPQALGEARHSLGRFDDAATAYRRSLALSPDTPDSAHSLAHTLLTAGVFEEGWRRYLQRPSVRSMQARYDRRPLPVDLRGKRLAVIGDQGLGDEIFFLRFVPALKVRGAHVTYCAHPKIAGMVSRLPCLDRTVETVGAIAAPIDGILSVGDLPHLMGQRSVADIPPPISLAALPERIVGMRRRLAASGPPPYVGIAWRAGVADLLFKQAPMPDLAAALRGIPGTVLSLQRQPRPHEVDAVAQALGAPVADFGDVNDDLEEMLALLILLDTFVSVSSTNVHLRVALRQPARILVPFPPEFRWMTGETRSPWFPGCTVYRQAPDGGWGNALGRLRRDLELDGIG